MYNDNINKNGDTSQENNKPSLSKIVKDALDKINKNEIELILFDKTFHISLHNIHSSTSIEKMLMVRSGVSKNDLDKIKKYAGVDYELLAKALSVTRATLINKKGKDIFNNKVSEGIIGLTNIYSYGYEVFGDVKRFNQWMLKPNNALGGKVPSEFLDNQFGREEVMNLIGRINYGVYS